MLNVENKEALLEFAFGRTDTCRMLVNKADNTQALYKVLILCGTILIRERVYQEII